MRMNQNVLRGLMVGLAACLAGSLTTASLRAQNPEGQGPGPTRSGAAPADLEEFMLLEPLLQRAIARAAPSVVTNPRSSVH